MPLRPVPRCRRPAPRCPRLTTRAALPAVAALLALAAAGCGGTSGGTSAPTTTTAPSTAAPTTTTTTSAPPSTIAASTTAPSTTAPSTTAPSTNAVPPDPQSSDDVAAADLIADWKAGDRASALHVATAAAVASLFATAYGGQTVIGRGCQDGQFPPVICSYGPQGGASASDQLYQLTLTQVPAGWYVSAVLVE